MGKLLTSVIVAARPDQKSVGGRQTADPLGDGWCGGGRSGKDNVMFTEYCRGVNRPAPGGSRQTGWPGKFAEMTSRYRVWVREAARFRRQERS